MSSFRFGQHGLNYFDSGYLGFKPLFLVPRKGTMWVGGETGTETNSTVVPTTIHFCRLLIPLKSFHICFSVEGRGVEMIFGLHTISWSNPLPRVDWSILVFLQSLSISDWLNTAVTADSVGDVIMVLIPNLFNNPCYLKRSIDRRFVSTLSRPASHHTQISPKLAFLKSPLPTGWF